MYRRFAFQVFLWYLWGMFTYRGKTVNKKQIAFIKALIVENPADSRRALSKKLCQAWNWVQPNGALRDMVCRGLMLELHRAGLIRLPAKKFTPHNPLARRSKPGQVEIDQSPVKAKLADLRPLELRQVRRTAEEPLFNGLIEQNHYLGYCQPVGEHLKYMVYAHGRPIACLAWSSAVRHTGRCKDDQSFKHNRSLKAVWGYPLEKDFRQRMTTEDGA